MTALALRGARSTNGVSARHGDVSRRMWRPLFADRPGGAVPIQRFNIVTNGTTATPLANQPENGWWWSTQESGRGYFLEWQGGQLFMAGYMYDDAGNPIWYLSGNSTPSKPAISSAV